MNSTYFADDCPALEELLERHFEHMRVLIRQRPGARAKVDALVLGGGYGRGEGGVLRSIAGTIAPALFNDLDYFLFTSHPGDHELQEMIHSMETAGRDTLGIDVDIKCLTVAEMGDPAESMMFHDLVTGHHVVHGPDDFLSARFARIEATRIPPLEASRLLWNRGTGLYFASCHIGRRENPDFVVRNHAKFKLAAGDALLALEGHYDASCRERFHRFRQHRPDQALGLDLADLHAEGVSFKLAPTRGARDWETLAEENCQLSILWSRLFLHAESLRLRKPFLTAADYVTGRDPRSPEMPRWKAPLYAVRDFLKFRRWLSPVWDYPRAALFRSLFCLLSDEAQREALPSPARFLAHASSRSGEASPHSAVSAWEPVYTFWWQRYG